MAKMIVKPKLSLGNQLYLYRLLRDALGCGKQTLMPSVEEALAAGDMAAVDLGFETTRELLEQLESCVQLTVFKGGRIYATVIAQPAWDEALAAGEPKQKATGKGAKSWKKKKGDKTLKAVKPKHVKRPKPEPEPKAASEPASDVKVAPEPVVEPELAAEAVSEPEHPAKQDSPSPEFDAAIETEVEIRNDAIFTIEDEESVACDDADAAETDSAAAGATPEPEAPQPAISLTVIYDPENTNAGIQTLESNPDAINELQANQELQSDQASEPKQQAAVTDTEKTSAEAADKDDAREQKPAAATTATTTAEPTSKATAEHQQAKRDRKTAPAPESAAKTIAQAKEAPALGQASDSIPEASDSSKRKAEPADKHDQKAVRHHGTTTGKKHASKAGTAPTAKPEYAANTDRQSQTSASTAATPKIPDGYPTDFTTEVFCPGALLNELSQLLPYGADVLGITGEYYWIARENGSIDAQRNRATFPLRYTRDGERHEVSVRIRRNTEGGLGANWSIDRVERTK